MKAISRIQEYLPFELTLGPAYDWHDEALCAQIDPYLFNPKHGDWSSIAKAKKICETCPVINECLAQALAQEIDPGGVWGGTSVVDRNEIRGKRNWNGTGTD